MLFMCKPYERGHSFRLNQRQLCNIDIFGMDEQLSKEIDAEGEGKCS